MFRDNVSKYRPFATVDLPDRQWPNRVQRTPPTWCSVDLRDGNQALIEPMDGERKRRFFDLLVEAGFKEIEVGFPSASQTDFDYVRELIETDAIPDDVTIQVLTQARPELIARTFEALQGAPRAILHLYNATAPIFRDVVFGLDRAGCIELATGATRVVMDHMERQPETDWVFEYSPETFCFTELDFALEICEAVMDVALPRIDGKKMIVNLPATVEVATPNVYADQIEWFCRNVTHRDRLIVSVHTHNDRGTAVAATELAMLAGADRVEGTVFGNGERTGNVDLFTLAMNLHAAGVDSGLAFPDIDRTMRDVEYCTQLPIHPRHPYAGELVFTAFSGSHQDAIRKGFAARERDGDDRWEVPYLPIDPADLGRTYEAVIRVNSQSGKGGVSWLLEQHGIAIPRRLQIEFSKVVQALADRSGEEITGAAVLAAFEREYLGGGTYALVGPRVESDGDATRLTATLRGPDGEAALEGTGNGPLAALVDALATVGIVLDIADYHEHAARDGASSEAYAYVEVRIGEGTLFGVGRHGSILVASLEAVISAVNRAAAQGRLATTASTVV